MAFHNVKIWQAKNEIFTREIFLCMCCTRIVNIIKTKTRYVSRAQTSWKLHAKLNDLIGPKTKEKITRDKKVKKDQSETTKPNV